MRDTFLDRDGFIGVAQLFVTTGPGNYVYWQFMKVEAIFNMSDGSTRVESTNWGPDGEQPYGEQGFGKAGDAAGNYGSGDSSKARAEQRIDNQLEHLGSTHALGLPLRGSWITATINHDFKTYVVDVKACRVVTVWSWGYTVRMTWSPPAFESTPYGTTSVPGSAE